MHQTVAAPTVVPGVKGEIDTEAAVGRAELGASVGNRNPNATNRVGQIANHNFGTCVCIDGHLDGARTTQGWVPSQIEFKDHAVDDHGIPVVDRPVGIRNQGKGLFQLECDRVGHIAEREGVTVKQARRGNPIWIRPRWRR